MMIVSQYKNLVLESYSDGFVLLESDYVADYNKILCDDNGNLYNVLDYKRIEEEEVFVITKQITLHRKIYFSCVKLDKPVYPGNTLSVVHRTYTQ